MSNFNKIPTQDRKELSFGEKIKKYGDKLVALAEVLGVLVFPAEANAQTFIGPDAQVGSVYNSGGTVVISDYVEDGVSQLGKKTEAGGMVFTPEEIEALRILNDKTIPKMKAKEEPKEQEIGAIDLMRENETPEETAVREFIEALDPNSKTNKAEKSESPDGKIYLDSINLNETPKKDK